MARQPYRFRVDDESHWETVRRLAAEAGWIVRGAARSPEPEITSYLDGAGRRVLIVTSGAEVLLRRGRERLTADRATVTRAEFIARLATLDGVAVHDSTPTG